MDRVSVEVKVNTSQSQENLIGMSRVRLVDVRAIADRFYISYNVFKRTTKGRISNQITMLNISSEAVLFVIGGSSDLCVNDAFIILDNFEFKGILNTKKPDEGNAVSCPPCQICDQIYKDFWFSCAIFADLCLSIIKYNSDLSVVVQPANEVSC